MESVAEKMINKCPVLPGCTANAGKVKEILLMPNDFYIDHTTRINPKYMHENFDLAIGMDHSEEPAKTALNIYRGGEHQSIFVGTGKYVNGNDEFAEFRKRQIEQIRQTQQKDWAKLPSAEVIGLTNGKVQAMKDYAALLVKKFPHMKKDRIARKVAEKFRMKLVQSGK